jgi:D-serine deaminase-like pyridoxal phosphate-dependent protein
VGANQAVVDYDERRRAMRRDLASLARLVERLRAESLAPEVVTGGGTGSHEIDAAEGILNEIQAGTYVFMDVNYLDVVMREDNPHPFSPSLFVRTTVIGAAQPGFVVTDAGAKELDGMHGPLAPRIASGAPPGARYSLVGDDLGRIDFASPADGLAVGEVVEVIPPHCYQTAVMYPVYHCVRGDTLVDIWPLEALVNS